MAQIFSYPQNTGSFIPTTQIWDPSEVYSSNLSPELKELLVRLYQNLNLMATNVNLKDTGYYNTLEFVNGQLYFPNPANNSSTSTYPSFRQVFRTIVNFGALPNAGLKSVAHNIPINESYSFTRIYAASSDQVGLNYIPIPYASPTLVNNIELNVDATNVNITTGSNRTNFTITYVVLEYIKS